MKLLLLYIGLFIYSLGFGQTYTSVIGFGDVNDGATSLLLNESNIYVGGYVGKDAFIKLINQNGQELWSTQFSFTAYHDVISDMQIDGQYIVGCGYGNERGSAIFEEFFFKFDTKNKTLVWIKRNNLKLKPSRVHVLNNGYYLFLGDEYANNKFGAFLLKLDAKNGSKKDFSAWYYSGKESSSSSFVHKGVVYTGGRYGLKPKVDKFRGAISTFQVSDFSQLWSKYYLNSKTKYVKSYLAALKLENDSIVSAFFTNNQGITSNFTASLAKMDLSGNMAWAKEYIPEDYSNITVRDMIVVKSGYIIYGFTKSPAKKLFLIKTDKQGNAVWANTYGDEMGAEISVDQGSLMGISNNHLFLVAQTKNNTAPFDNNAILLKLNLDGTSDNSCAIEKLALNTKNYADLIEGEIGLTKYDTIYRSVNVNLENTTIYPDKKGYLCSPGMANNDFDTLYSDTRSIAFIDNDVLPIDEAISISIIQKPLSGEVSIEGDSLFNYTTANKVEASCSIDSFSYVLKSKLVADTAWVYLYPIVQKVVSNKAYNLTDNAKVNLEPSITNANDYVWSNGSTKSSITVNAMGMYSVTFTTEGCLYKESFEVAEDIYSFENIATNNITFLLDVSLSMNRKDRLPVLKQSMLNVLEHMREEDKLSVITYSDNAELILNGIAANDVQLVEGKIDSLLSDGQSDVMGGLKMGVNTIENNYQQAGNNRIIFTTDGVISNEKRAQLVAAIKKELPTNTYFTIFLFNNSSVYEQQLQEVADEVGGQLYVVSDKNVEQLLLQEFRAIRK